MTQTLTTDRLKQIASGDAFICTQDDESVAMARELLANREAQPVQAPFMHAICNPDGSAWLDENCVAGTAEELKPVLSDLRRDTGDGFCIVPLYTAPPAPSVPKEMTKEDAMAFVRERPPFKGSVECVQATWNACRAAMLAQPVSQGKLPDCVLVLLNHIEDVLDDESWSRISVEKWNAVTMLAAAPEGGNEK